MSSRKGKDFKSQEKRERKIGKTVGVHAVGGWADRKKERKKGRKKERKKEEIADNKNPEQTAGQRSTSI